MPRIPVFIYTADPATGNALPSVTCTVKNRITNTNVSLFSAETGGSSVTNPLTSDSLGRAFAWTERVPLKIDYSGAGITAYTEERGDVALPTFESTLPASPYEGQEIYFQDAALATLGIVWHLRYRAGGGTYKWESVGGSPLRTQVAAGGGPASITSATWSNAPTTQCDLTLPLNGDYVAMSQTQVLTAAAGVIQTGIAVGVAGSPTPLTSSVFNSGAGGYTTGYVATVLTNRSAGDVLRIRYWNSSTGNITVSGTSLIVTPIRVG